MSTKTTTKSPFQIIFDVLAILGFLGVFGFFIWHTAAYMDRIFEPPTPGDSRDYRDIAAAAVQFAVTIAVTTGAVALYMARIRGQGQAIIDHPR